MNKAPQLGFKPGIFFPASLLEIVFLVDSVECYEMVETS